MKDIDSLLDHVVIIDGTLVLLNASVKTICDKVYFAEQGMNEPKDTALYVQPSVQGNSVIFPNTHNEETNLNLDLNTKSAAELNDELVAAKKELFNLRFQNATNQLDNTSRIKEVRKNIARIQTVIAQKANAAE